MSIGITDNALGSVTEPNELYASADKALCAAKEGGRLWSVRRSRQLTPLPKHAEIVGNWEAPLEFVEDHAGPEVVIARFSDTIWDSYDDIPPNANFFGKATLPPCCGIPSSFVPGATAIWDPGVACSSYSAFTQFFFTKVVNAPGTPTSCTITMGYDDLAEVIVNGVSVVTAGSVTDPNCCRDQTTFSLPASAFKEGENLIVVRAQNGGPPGFGTISEAAWSDSCRATCIAGTCAASDDC